MPKVPVCLILHAKSWIYSKTGHSNGIILHKRLKKDTVH